MQTRLTSLPTTLLYIPTDDGKLSIDTHPGAWPSPPSRLRDVANFSDVSNYGHDKSQAILPYGALPNPPTLFFFGDGVSGEFLASCIKVNHDPRSLIAHKC